MPVFTKLILMIIQLTPKNLSNVLRGNICCKIKSPRYRQFPHRRCPFAGRDWSRISSADPVWGRFNLQKPLTAFGFPKTKKASESTLSTPFLFWENGPLRGPAFSGWGRERIRTAVRGFADLCLATRPPDLFSCSPLIAHLLQFLWTFLPPRGRCRRRRGASPAEGKYTGFFRSLPICNQKKRRIVHSTPKQTACLKPLSDRRGLTYWRFPPRQMWWSR